VNLLDLVARILALTAITAGVAFIYWPAALIVGGVLLLVDRIT
jgi:hypothetical protein